MYNPDSSGVYIAGEGGWCLFLVFGSIRGKTSAEENNFFFSIHIFLK